MNPQDNPYDPNGAQQPPVQPWQPPQPEQTPGQASPANTYEDPQHPVLPPVAPGAQQPYEHPSAPPVSSSPLGFVPIDIGGSAHAAGDVHGLPTAPTPVSLPPAYTAASQQSPKKKRSWLKRTVWAFVILIVVLGLALLGLAEGSKMFNKVRSTYHNHTQSQQFKSLSKLGSGITAADVAKLNKADAFYAVFANAAQQKVVTTKIAAAFLNAPNNFPTSAAQSGSASETTLNYVTKKYSYDSDLYDFAVGNQPDKTRCIGAQSYTYLALFPDHGWQKGDTDDSRTCTLQSVGDFSANDGLNTGGLTSAQAQTFVNSLRNADGVLHVNSAALAKQSGKSYIKFDVTVTPIKGGGDEYLGLQYFMWAFKDAGLNPATWPYSYAGAAADGMHMAYYVDPSTLLPAFSQQVTTGTLDVNGKLESDQTYDYRHVEYSFGGDVPTLNLAGQAPITFAWPFGKL